MSDPRFARLKTDPHFRRPKKYNSKVVVDERFKGIFGEGGFIFHSFSPRIVATGRDNLKQFHRLEHEVDEAETPTSTIPDYARGGVLMESSESGAESQGAADFDNESDRSGFVTLGRDLDEEGELNLDDKEATEKTRRLAVVNLDWGYVRAAHLYKIFSSLVSPAAAATLPVSVPMQSKDEKSLKNTKSARATVARGNVLSVRVYPSEFGKERIAREEKEGPPVEVFKKKIENEEDVNERTIHETGDGADYDERKYQLERLRTQAEENGRREGRDGADEMEEKEHMQRKERTQENEEGLWKETSSLISGLAVERPSQPPPISKSESPASIPMSTTSPTSISTTAPLSHNALFPSPTQHQPPLTTRVWHNDTLAKANDEETRMRRDEERLNKGRSKGEGGGEPKKEVGRAKNI
ncbi:hypothetical protein BDR04DRAFT_1163853 [Suillus decipiens]|nr:hypothetical protein BDR04DRAFT_1163853 [Suillus decipiens]